MIVRAGFAVLAVALVAGGLAGCTSSGGARPPTTSIESTPAAPASTATIGLSTKPISAGPTTAVSATSCPLAPEPFVRATIGMRLARITVLRSGGKAVGCRFYALQNDPLARSEHLPGPNQPAVEITTQRYASATAAHNAFVLTAEKGTNPQQVPLGGGVIAVCYQTDFDPHDKGRDYACAVSKGTTELVVRSVDTTGTLSTSTVTRTVLRGL